MAETGYRIFKALIKPLQKLPLGFHYAMGSVFAWFAEKVVRYRRDVIITNLSRSFPELKYKAISSLAHDYYKHMGEIFAEAMWFGGCAPGTSRLRDSHMCEARGMEELVRIYKANPHVILLNSHFGNFETLGGFLQYSYEIPPEELPFGEENICVVYKRLFSDFWDHFFRDNRAAPLTDFRYYVESKNVLRFALAHKNDPLVFIFDNDQHPYKRSTGHNIGKFMNQETEAMAGAVALAHRYGLGVMYICFDRIERGRYEMRLTPICDDGRQMSEEEMLARYYSLLEADIRKTPANYLWSHRRWK